MSRVRSGPAALDLRVYNCGSKFRFWPASPIPRHNACLGSLPAACPAARLGLGPGSATVDYVAALAEDRDVPDPPAAPASEEYQNEPP